MAYSQQWLKFVKEYPIEWLDRNFFWIIFDEKYRQSERYFSLRIPSHMKLYELRQRIKKAPTFSPYEEENFAGPVERWYGKIGNDLFILDHHYMLENYNEIRCEKNDKVQNKLTNMFEKFKNVHPFFGDVHLYEAVP